MRAAASSDSLRASPAAAPPGELHRSGLAATGTEVHVVESRLTGKEHLEKAGLLAVLEAYP